MSDKTKLDQLKEPFHAEDIEWRVQSSGIDRNSNPWVMVIPYITSRAVMDRLDEVFGFDGWEDKYREWKGKGQICTLSVNVDDKWITKEDGADDTNIESTKGGLSDALKRAGVKFGIGRYLYKLDAVFAKTSTDKIYENRITIKPKGSNPVYATWETPSLPACIKDQREVKALMEKANVDDDLFMEFFGISGVSRIKKENLEKVLIQLEKKVMQVNAEYAKDMQSIIHLIRTSDNERILDAYYLEFLEKVDDDDEETKLYVAELVNNLKEEMKK